MNFLTIPRVNGSKTFWQRCCKNIVIERDGGDFFVAVLC